MAESAKNLLGHKWISTTQIYADTLHGKEVDREALVQVRNCHQEVAEVRAEVSAALLQKVACDEGRHTPHPLYAWRCEHCPYLLCRTCSEEIDRCCCKGAP